MGQTVRRVGTLYQHGLNSTTWLIEYDDNDDEARTIQPNGTLAVTITVPGVAAGSRGIFSSIAQWPIQSVYAAMDVIAANTVALYYVNNGPNVENLAEYVGGILTINDVTGV